MKSVTPIITVESIEDSLPFWTDRLGFDVTVTVPHGDELGFAIVQKEGVEIMYQSHASVADDLPPLAEELSGQSTLLFIKLDDLSAIEPALGGADIVVPRRTTFYGMDEIFVRAPCGTVVGFAAPSSV